MNKKYLVALASLLLLAPALSEASGGYVGGMLGPAFNFNGGGTHFFTAADGGWKPIPQLGLGLFAGTEIIMANKNNSTTQSIVGFKPTYFTKGDGNGITLAVIVGEGVRSVYTSTSSGNVTTTTHNNYHAFAFGPSVGYNIFLLPHLSLEPQVNYLMVGSQAGNPQRKTLNLAFGAKFEF